MTIALTEAEDPLLARNKEILRKQIEELWGKGNYAVADEIYGERIIDHMPIPGQGDTKADLIQVVRDFRAAIPDLHMQVYGLIAEGDKVVDYWRLTGTHRGEIMGIAPSGNAIDFHGMDIVRIQDGLIAEIWHVEELWKMFAQMRGEWPAAP